MTKRGQIGFGMGLGAAWAVLVVWGAQIANLPFIPLPIAVPLAVLWPGLVMVAMIGRLAARRFFDDSIIDGQALAQGTAAEIDQRVLTNTMEQAVLALLIWPFVSLTLGSGVVIALGVSFGLMRVLFWVGYHMAPPLRSLGFAGTFYPTVLAGLWSLLAWAT
ncbi:MAG: MAPEG family protein [Paracoccaceae bacterium]|jgi:hypothetical protein